MCNGVVGGWLSWCSLRWRQPLLGLVPGAAAFATNVLNFPGEQNGYVVAFLPIGLGAALNAINPAFMQPLFTQTIGQILIGVGVVMMTIGFLAIRKITDIKV